MLTSWFLGLLSRKTNAIVSNILFSRNDDLTYEGGYNDVTNEVYAWSSSNPVQSDGSYLIAYRWNAVTLAPASSPVTTHNSNLSFSSPPSNLNWTFDSSRGLFWVAGFFGSRTSGVATLMQYDATTWNCVKAVDATSAAVNGATDASLWNVVINPTNNDVWVFDHSDRSSVHTLTVRKIDPTTGTFNGSETTVSQAVNNWFVAPNGKVWCTTQNNTISDPGNLKNVWIFDFSNQTFTKVYTHTNDLNGLTYDSTRNTVWLSPNDATQPSVEISAVDYTLTGRQFNWPYLRGKTPTYDKLNDVYWSMSWQTPHVKDGSIMGIKATDLSVFAEYIGAENYDSSNNYLPPNPPGIFGIVENAGYPEPGRENAVYCMDQVFLEAENTTQYRILKIPVGTPSSPPQ